jgi:kumamolisin
MRNHTIHVGYYAPKSAIYKGKLSDDHQLNTTWVLHRGLSNVELTNITASITKFCADFGLKVFSDIPYHLSVSGSAKSFSNALLTNLHTYEDGDSIYHTSNELKLPTEWAHKIVHIFGLDNSPIVKPYVQLLKVIDDSSIQTSNTRKLTPHISPYFNPLQLATLYNFPSGDGTGQKIGIIELGGGFVQSDINTYFSNLGLTSPPKINAISVDGAQNNPSDTSGASIEVILDVEVIAALAPKATINVYFGPNSDKGFYDAINRAITDNCSIVSISWGGAETYWNGSSLTAYNSLFQTAANNKVTILAAAGDNGSSDGAPGNNVDFPASSPYVLACGGTTLVANGSTIASEVVWNNNPSSSATGGGISSVFSEPSYQIGRVTFNLSGQRGVPDVAGNANPNTGYILYSQSIGGSIVVGGTSAVSPLWSGLLARINQNLNSNNKQNVGFAHSTLYNNANSFRDITSGTNGSYSASVGWDPCTGNGTPNGTALLTTFMNAGTVPSPPTAAFNVSPSSGNTPLTVNFTNNSTGSATSYLWTFGDGTTSTTTSPTHQYINSVVGTTTNFTATLTATNTGGSNSLSKTISVTNPSNVQPLPTASFSATPLSGNSPLLVTFTNTSVGATSYLWNFGDGTSSTATSPTHTYTNINVGTTVTYTVSLTTTNSTGSTIATRSNYISVYNPAPTSSKPTAAFLATPVSGKHPLKVQFTDQSTGVPTSWTWLFGDGNISNVRNPTNTYQNSGQYTVSLVVSNSKGASSVVKTNLIKIV